MNTYRVRTKCAESVNISRRKIKKYVKMTACNKSALFV